MAYWGSLFRVVLIISRMVNKCLSKLVGVSHGLMGELRVVLIILRVVSRCLSKLVGVSHGLMGELFVLNRFIVFVVGEYLSQ